MRDKIITIADDEEYLRQISESVDLNDPKLNDELKLLEECCKKTDVLALAYIQIGIPKRLIYLKNTDLENILDEEHDEAKILINPKIIKREGLTTYMGSKNHSKSNITWGNYSFDVTTTTTTTSKKKKK